MCIIGLIVTSALFAETIEARRWNEISQLNTHFVLSGDSFILLNSESSNYWYFKIACISTQSETRSLMGIFAFYALDRLLQIRPFYIYPIAMKAGSNTVVIAKVRYPDSPDGPDGPDLAIILVSSGLATVDRYQANEYCKADYDELLRAEKYASDHRIGIWGPLNLFTTGEYGDESL